MITANGYPVLQGRIVRPFEGRWSAALQVDTDTALASPVELLDTDSDFRAVASVRRGGVFLDTGHVRLVAGAGGLLEEVPARSYRTVPARLVLAQLLAETGEALSERADAGLLATLLPYWTRPAGTADRALARLVTHLGATWRADLDGTVWIGTDTWPIVELEGALEEDPAAGRCELGPAALEEDIAPGMLLLDRRVSTVVWTIRPERLRCTVTFLDG